MNIFDLNTNNITMNIDGKDIEMKHPICYGKKYDKWLVSRCGKVWSLPKNKLIQGHITTSIIDGKKYIKCIDYQPTYKEEDWWGDGSGRKTNGRNHFQRHIAAHKMIIDTWAPLWDNPPKGTLWEQWVIVRELDTIYDYFTKSGAIDHIDNDPTNNHLDNLQRVNDWDNNPDRKAKGI
jgi:hypothetical protein